MEYPSLAYSTTMQILLAGISLTTTFIFYFFVTSTMLALYREKATFRQMALVSFLSGAIPYSIWVYGIFLIGGMRDFTPIVYRLVTIPNPLFGVAFYMLSLRVFGFSRVKSLNLMFQVYVYMLINKQILRLGADLFFKQPGGAYNYLLDALSLITCTIVNTGVCFLMRWVIHRMHAVLVLPDMIPVRQIKWYTAISFLKATLSYVLLVVFPFVVAPPYDSLILLGILVFILVISMMNDYRKYYQAKVENDALHIRMLTDALEEFRGVKHDFYNILNTYGGYLQLGDLEKLRAYHESLLEITTLAGDRIDLQEKMEQNPALLAMVTSKMDYARQRKVHFEVNILCSVADMYIPVIDLCRAAANLVDNAIEAAAESEAMRASLSIEQRADGGKLIVIKNSTAGDVDIAQALSPAYTTKMGHPGIGLIQSRKILSAYVNCTIQLTCYQKEFTTYISLAPTAAWSSAETAPLGGGAMGRPDGLERGNEKALAKNAQKLRMPWTTRRI